MGFFGASSPFDPDVEKATSETNTNENWALIMDICDKVTSKPRNAKECLRSIMKRMGHTDPHVSMQAITLLDACISNCGKPFHLEVASRDFETEFKRLLGKVQSKVAQRMRKSLMNWAENEFKSDSELNLIPSLYTKLRSDVGGYDMGTQNEKSAGKTTASAAKLSIPKDPNVVSSQQEQDDIAKAIELSLKEVKSSPSHQTQNTANTSAGASSTAYPTLYPSFGGGGAAAAAASTNSQSSSAAAVQPEPRKVRALYDFEAAEENELTFLTGEIIHVVDDSDANWWKGFNQRGDGLFPSNFVTADLNVDPKQLDELSKAQRSNEREMQQKTEAAAAAAANATIEIDEMKIDRLLHLLHEANPEDSSQDSDEMLQLEQEVLQMAPLIDDALERIESKHAQLAQLSQDFVKAIELYNSLIADERSNIMSNYGTMGIGMGYAGSMYGTASGGGFPANSQVFGMPSASMTANDASSMNVFSSMGGASMHTQQPMSIPMQFQNGHMPQMQPINGGAGGLNSLPSHMNTAMSGPNGQTNTTHAQMFSPLQQQQTQHQHAQVGGQTQLNFAMVPQQQQIHQGQFHAQNQANTSAIPAGNNVSQSQQQQQSGQHAQFMPENYMHTALQQPLSQTMPPFGNMMPSGSMALPPNASQIPTNQTQLYGAVHLQQQQLPSLPPQVSNAIPNGHSDNANNGGGVHHAGSLTMPPNTGVVGMPPSQAMPHAPPASAHQSAEHHFSQMQQQMAAMSMGAAAGINQPVTQHFLVQNEPKNNIPIYQQQR